MINSYTETTKYLKELEEFYNLALEENNKNLIQETLENIKSASYRGDAKIEWFEKAPICTQAREYQREKVATLYWKQQLMTTVIRLSLGYADCFLNPIHIRVKHSVVGVEYEVIDGQQRVTTVTDFLKNIRVSKKYKKFWSTDS